MNELEVVDGKVLIKVSVVKGVSRKRDSLLTSLTWTKALLNSSRIHTSLWICYAQSGNNFLHKVDLWQLCNTLWTDTVSRKRVMKKEMSKSFSWTRQQLLIKKISSSQLSLNLLTAFQFFSWVYFLISLKFDLQHYQIQ